MEQMNCDIHSDHISYWNHGIGRDHCIGSDWAKNQKAVKAITRRTD